MAGVKTQLESLKCYDLMKIHWDLLSKVYNVSDKTVNLSLKISNATKLTALLIYLLFSAAQQFCSNLILLYFPLAEEIIKYDLLKSFILIDCFIQTVHAN